MTQRFGKMTLLVIFLALSFMLLKGWPPIQPIAGFALGYFVGQLIAESDAREGF